MKKLYAVVPALFLFFLATIVSASPPEPGDGKTGGSLKCHGSMGPGHRFENRLNLTKEQKEKARELELRFHAETRDLRYGLEQKRLEMRKLFTDPKTGEADLVAKEREIGELQQKMFEKRVQMKIEWRRMLTAEQIRELDRMPVGPEPGPPPGPHMGPAAGPHTGPAAMRFHPEF